MRDLYLKKNWYFFYLPLMYACAVSVGCCGGKPAQSYIIWEESLLSYVQFWRNVGRSSFFYIFFYWKYSYTLNLGVHEKPLWRRTALHSEALIIM